jgi:D-sedoheptulose 7-phosphate isomerase
LDLLQKSPALGQIQKVVELLVTILTQRKKLMIMGNGGSAADAQHLAAELVNTFHLSRPALPAIALTVNASNLTAIANDLGYNEVFARQIEALGSAGDAVMGITSSDVNILNNHSVNLLNGFRKARSMKIKTIGLVSTRCVNLLEFIDIPIIIPGKDTPRIQEMQILAEHIICDLVEKKLFP